MTDDDHWLQEEFEDAITRGMLACFESRPIEQKGAFPADRLSRDDLASIRAHGLYIPGKARVVMSGDPPDGTGFDAEVDGFPSNGTVLFPWTQAGNQGPDDYKGYCRAHAFQRMINFPKGIHRFGPGKPYRLTLLLPQDEGGVTGEKHYFSIDRTGRVHLAERRWQSGCDRRPCHSRQMIGTMTDQPHIARQLLYGLPVILQYTTDERHCWRIEAIEGVVRVRLGCEREEVKSLLYARDAPRTATGRKRPILHLVSAHRRRVREGIDIDIDRFLRGTREVEMDGTLFRVHPPHTLLQELQ